MNIKSEKWQEKARCHPQAEYYEEGVIHPDDPRASYPMGILLTCEQYEYAAKCVNTMMGHTYISNQTTHCAGCGKDKHTPIRNDDMGGYVCLTCIDKELKKFHAMMERAIRVERYNSTDGQDDRIWICINPTDGNAFLIPD